MEEWKPIIGFIHAEGLYEVSNEGKIRSVDRTLVNSLGQKRFYKGKILSTHYNHKGYLRVQLGKEGAVCIHRIVAKTFIPNPENKPQVNHIDGDKNNNFSNNLEWVTMKENLDHAWKNELRNANGLHTYNNSRSLKVGKYSLDGDLLEVYESANDAARSLGNYKLTSNILNVCKGKRKKANGFYWKFV